MLPDLSFTLPPRVVVARAMARAGTIPTLYAIDIIPLAGASGGIRIDSVADYTTNAVLSATNAELGQSWAAEALASVAPLAVTEFKIAFSKPPAPGETDLGAAAEPAVRRAFSRLAITTLLTVTDLDQFPADGNAISLVIDAINDIEPFIDLRHGARILAQMSEAATDWAAATTNWRRDIATITISFIRQRLSAHQRLAMTERLAKFVR